MDSPTPIPIEKVLAEEYVRLNGDPCKPDGAPLKDDLKALYRRIHEDAKGGRKRTALSISGGGIRSATFALGVIQQLARFGILEQFDDGPPLGIAERVERVTGRPPHLANGNGIATVTKM